MKGLPRYGVAKCVIVLSLLAMGLVGCKSTEQIKVNPRVEVLRLPPLPASLKSPKCQTMATIPDRKLSGKELVALLAEVRASEAYKAGCNKDFEKWYSTIQSAYKG